LSTPYRTPLLRPSRKRYSRPRVRRYWRAWLWDIAYAALRFIVRGPMDYAGDFRLRYYDWWNSLDGGPIAVLMPKDDPRVPLIPLKFENDPRHPFKEEDT
jgi:hypothetical protein